MLQIASDTPLFEVVGARVPALRRLEKMGVKTVHDLLWHFPTRYEDFTKIYPIAELEPGQQATITGVVEEIQSKHSWRRAMSIVEATIADESGAIRAVWFNQPYVANVLKVGRMANFAGKASTSEEGEIYLNNPVYEVIHVRDAATQEMNHTARLVPVYPETRGLTSRGIRFVTQALFRKKPMMKEWIPTEILAEFHFPELNEAIHSIHFPRQIEDATAARARFSFEELFLLQILNMQQKMKLATERAPVITADIERVKAMLARLPFELTHSQKQSLWEIIKDIEKPRPMNRLLQGDVGSGKTVVAAVAALIAAENKLQTAFMAPTEILARQHFETMKKLFINLALGEQQPVIGLITGSSAHIFYGNELEAKISKPEFSKKVAAGEVSIIFGTHALIQKTISFAALGLVIIDEQHRFGVRQRAELNAHKGDALIPHFFSMSATPIPRTLMLSVFGDLDLSLITELPVGRKEIKTEIVAPLKRTATYNFIREQIKEGRQAFVICPRIDPEDEEAAKAAPGGKAAFAKKLELKSVKEEFEKLSQKIFPDLRIAKLHGQMKPKEKEEVMRRFKDREFDILVATSVVEVGVDVPNASIMMIEGADRFGLAQLYQFRGRVGRGEYQSYCFLMADSQAAAANARLKAILEAKNGFELAEKDLALRGPGQFFGNVQTGLPDIAMEALRDPELVKHSREAAIKAVTADPQFKKNVALRKKVEEFRARVHQE
ncbi:MAG: ATP-dependent DNA helicase RecG [Minisyncoccia bacterium]|jgi:ATP-dependent DNA helicase RecG